MKLAVLIAALCASCTAITLAPERSKPQLAPACEQGARPPRRRRRFCPSTCSRCEFYRTGLRAAGLGCVEEQPTWSDCHLRLEPPVRHRCHPRPSGSLPSNYSSQRTTSRRTRWISSMWQDRVHPLGDPIHSGLACEHRSLHAYPRLERTPSPSPVLRRLGANLYVRHIIKFYEENQRRWIVPQKYKSGQLVHGLVAFFLWYGVLQSQ